MTHPRFFMEKTKRTKEEIDIGDSVSFVTRRDFKRFKFQMYVYLTMLAICVVVLGIRIMVMLHG